MENKSLREIAHNLGIPYETLDGNFMEKTMTEAEQVQTQDEINSEMPAKAQRRNPRFGVRLPRRVFNALAAEADARGEQINRRAADILVRHYDALAEQSGRVPEASETGAKKNVMISESQT